VPIISLYFIGKIDAGACYRKEAFSMRLSWRYRMQLLFLTKPQPLVSVVAKAECADLLSDCR
jgi:hypothetical protein